ncbi:hypothetical protein F4808DRAFT_311390 [Astrocystis sublimbata]|nr:hypothetical protein F4808DRAFT_311390 [Astrocystis sublimbata]
MKDDTIFTIGAPIPSGADATSPQPRHINAAKRADIQIPAPSAATDRALVAELTRLVNDVYAEAEGTIYKNAFERTSAPQIEDHLRAGELAVAFLDSTHVDAKVSPLQSDSGPSSLGTPVGCVCIKQVAPTVGEFGMLAVEPTYRGTGLGRDLVVFAEERCRRDLGLAVMRLELLVPQHFEHAGKTRLQVWYTRLGYVMTRLADFGIEFPKLNALLAGPTEFRIFEKQLVAG